IQRLQATLADDVGPFRTAGRLARALATIDQMTLAIGERPIGDGGAFDLRRLEWFDLRNMLLVARAITAAALARKESRGAHQREDFAAMDSAWDVNQVVTLAGDRIALSRVAVDVREAAQCRRPPHSRAGAGSAR